jgi:dihydropteroate synthase
MSMGSVMHERGVVMGILNVTPDSFSDGGAYFDHASAIAHGRAMIEQGAAIVDIGGESTRPGAAPVATAEELRRVIPVVEALAGDVRVSIDTTKPEVARAAVTAGATLINDVSASLHAVAGELGVGWVAMHRRGTPSTMQLAPEYTDVVGEVEAFLLAAVAAGRTAGVEEVWIDPGIGFGKTSAHNLALLANIERFVASGVPVMIGVSRKRFIGELTAKSDRRGGAGRDDDTVDTRDRLDGSLTYATHAFASGVAVVRAHDVLATVQAAKVVG